MPADAPTLGTERPRPPMKRPSAQKLSRLIGVSALFCACVFMGAAIVVAPNDHSVCWVASYPISMNPSTSRVSLLTSRHADLYEDTAIGSVNCALNVHTERPLALLPPLYEVTDLNVKTEIAQVYERFQDAAKDPRDLAIAEAFRGWQGDPQWHDGLGVLAPHSKTLLLRGVMAYACILLSMVTGIFAAAHFVVSNMPNHLSGRRVVHRHPLSA
ncbi:MAG TPA: hypothetical protein VG797_00385 [Phycisphaerales bacterium]|nr:hypothetical protein [Phycisphaerales bacterium]